MESDNDKMEQIVRLVEKVERANRRLTLISFALGAMLVLVLALGATGGSPAPGGATKQAAVLDVIKARKLTLVDRKGRERATLDMDDAGAPELVLHDGKGGLRASMALTDTGAPQLAFFDESGKVRALLIMFESGDPGIRLFQVEDKAGAYHTPEIAVVDKDSKIIWKAPPEKE